MAKKTSTPEASEEQRQRNFLGQKPRTTKEEQDAWGRRVRRQRKALEKEGLTPEACDAHIDAVMGGLGTYTAKDDGLKLWAYKAYTVLGRDGTVAYLNSIKTPVK